MNTIEHEIQKFSELKPFNLEWIDSEIKTFMESIQNGTHGGYSIELIELAREIIESNPQAFSNFLTKPTRITNVI